MADSESVDWHAVPGRPGYYQPDVIEPALRQLAEAKRTAAAAGAVAWLEAGGLVHGHSSAVMPAAAVAAPILLDIVERGHPVAKEGAAGLLGLSMGLIAFDGYDRVSVSFGPTVPICCAVAHHVHARRDTLREIIRPGVELRSEAADHWQFEVGELIADGDDTVASGILHGTIRDGRHDAECHTPAGHSLLGAVSLTEPVARGERTARLRLFDVEPQAVPAQAVLISAECGRLEH